MSQRRDENGKFTSRKSKAKVVKSLYTRGEVLHTVSRDELLGVILNQTEDEQRKLVQTILAHGYDTFLLLAKCPGNNELWRAINGHMLDTAKLLVEYGDQDKMAITVINIAQDLLAHAEELESKTTGESDNQTMIDSIFGAVPIHAVFRK
jgi:hypothetical protein